MKANEGKRKEIGLAVVGSGTIGRIRAVLAKDYPGVGWLGVCDIKEDLAKKLAEDAGADFYTTDHRELLKRSEVNAAIIATDENNHVAPDPGRRGAGASSLHRKTPCDGCQGFKTGV